MKCLIYEYWLTFYFKRIEGILNGELDIQIRTEKKFKRKICEDKNTAKDEYNNDMGDWTSTKNGYDINRGDGNGTKDRYNNDIENGVFKCNIYRLIYNKNKYHII